MLFLNRRAHRISSVTSRLFASAMSLSLFFALPSWGNLSQTSRPKGCYEVMKYLVLFIFVFVCTDAYAQHTPLPHGMVFGKKPDTAIVINAKQIADYMGNKPRIITTIKGTVIKVTKEKGGWFTLDAGQGKEIAVNFSNFKVTLPAELEGRVVIIEGIAFKQFIPGNRQRLSGDTTDVKGGPVKNGNVALKFEAAGLLVYK